MFHDFAQRLLQEIAEEEAKRGETEEQKPPSPQEIPQVGTSFTLEIDDLEITITDQSPGMSLYSVIGPMPSEDQEELLTTLLRGNFLGQATRKASLGLNEKGDMVTLNHYVASIGNYREFHDAVEDFINAACFWAKRLHEAAR